MLQTVRRTIEGPKASIVVLLVEDDPLIRLSTAEYLEEAGFGVIEAASADDAMAMLVADADAVHVVFSDIQMPGRADGLELANWLREFRPSTPFLLASGNSLPTAAQDIPFIQKPYDLRAVARQIEGAVGRQRH